MNSTHGGKIRRLYPASALISLLLPGIISLNCNNFELQSQWRDRDITVDGNHVEWEGVLKYSEDERTTVGFFNDDEYLYLCLLSADQQVLMQAMGAGFTVWFEGSGKRDERLTIRFPLGSASISRQDFRRDREKDNPNRIGEFLREQSEMVITQDDLKAKLGLLDLDDYGLQAKIGRHLGRMVYEIRVPLQGSDKAPYAINAQAGKTIKIGFELGKLEMPEMERRPRGDGMGKGGMRPGGGMGRGGSRGVRRPDQPPEFKFEISVKLAKKAVTADY
jgi:hypothetical protein